jgi:uncharacterized protein YndB with AHSA1/START domain
MAQIKVETERAIAAPAARVFECIADFKTHRPKWLPPAYSNLSVEQGGTGAGTVARYHLKVGPRERDYRMQVSEPTPGSVLQEKDTTSSLVTTWTVTPQGSGSRVGIATQWTGGSGFGGFMERMFAPRALKRLYDDELSRLADYAMGKTSSSV